MNRSYIFCFVYLAMKWMFYSFFFIVTCHCSLLSLPVKWFLPLPSPKVSAGSASGPASGPRDHLRPYLALEPRVHRACWPATFCRDPPPPDYRVRLFRTLWTVARLPGSSVCGTLQARVLSGLQCPPPGGLPAPGIKPGSPAPSALHADSFPMSHSLSPKESSTSCRC